MSARATVDEKKHPEPTESQTLNRVTFQLKPVPPFRLDLTAWALRREPANKLDRWDGKTYQRDLAQGSVLFEVSVTQSGTIDKPLLEVDVTGDEPGVALQEDASKAISWLLGTDIDLTGFYQFAAHHPEMRFLIDHFRGVKPERFPTLFETLTNGFIFQQISLGVCPGNYYHGNNI